MKTAIPAKTDRNCTHLAGEYFVAAELSRRGYAIGITMGNAKAIDLVVEKDAQTVAVQVKAIARRKNVGWPVMRNQIKPRIIYVLVCLNEPGEQPTYFVLTSDEALSKVKQYETRGIIDYGTVKGDEFRERWDKIEIELQRRNRAVP